MRYPPEPRQPTRGLTYECRHRRRAREGVDRPRSAGRHAMIDVSELPDGKDGACRVILDDLPEWFGIPEAKDAYVTASRALPMLVARVGQETAGFVSLQPQTEFAIELMVLGVKRRFH